MSDREEMCKAERLAVAGVVAPFLRENAEKAAQRRVARVDAEGNVVGYTTLAEVQKSLLRRHEIEIQVQPGTRPKDKLCERCGKKFLPANKGRTAKTCPLCRSRGLTASGKTCANPACSSPEPRHARFKSNIASRKGEPWRCKPCALWYLSQGTERSIQTQKVCAGFGDTEGTCQAKVARHAFTPTAIKKRDGRPWLCKSCATTKRHKEQPWVSSSSPGLKKANALLTKEHRQAIGAKGTVASRGKNALDLRGRKFGPLVAVKRADSEPGKTKWECRCDCGALCEVTTVRLLHKNPQSCSRRCPLYKKKAVK